MLGLAWNLCGRAVTPITGRWPAAGLVAGLVLATWVSPIWLGISVILASLLAAYGPPFLVRLLGHRGLPALMACR